MKFDPALATSNTNDQDSSQSVALQVTQPNKLYIKIKMRATNVGQLEKKFSRYFADFGEIEDIKILQNSWLIRTIKIVRIRIF